MPECRHHEIRAPCAAAVRMSAVVHVVEPTLVSEAGHCSTVVQGLVGAGPGLNFQLWVGSGAVIPTLEATGVSINRHFRRRLRKWQGFLLYRRLLRRPGAIVVPTAGRFDLAALHYAASGLIPPNKVYLYFHHLRLSPAKTTALRRLAQAQPRVTLLGTTDYIVERLRNLGFANTQVVLPLPVAEPVEGPTAPFRHVLVAGAARPDKGFGQIVDLIEHLAAIGATLPIAVQVSGDHYDRHDPRTADDLRRLRAIRYPGLRLLSETLRRDEYAALFRGAIALQPYDREEYADKISGITLDAFTAPAPIVTLSQTWMARMAERFDAGVATPDARAETLLCALNQIAAEYARYRDNARLAGQHLRAQHTWAPVVASLTKAPG